MHARISNYGPLHARFHTEGRGAGIPPPPPSHNLPNPEILKLSMVIILAICMLLNVSMCHQNVRKFCPRLHQKQSERYINSKFFWRGACPQTPLVGMHAFRTLLSSCYHPVPPPNSKSCMKPCYGLTGDVYS